jgi:hypothetical protein
LLLRRVDGVDGVQYLCSKFVFAAAASTRRTGCKRDCAPRQALFWAIS